MQEGWISLHRKIQDCEIWSNSQPFDMRSAWVDLLLLANHRDATIIFDYSPMTIKRGQYLTSVRKLCARWSWSKDRTLKYLRLLESLGMIHRESNNQRTLITIEKYEVYQDAQDTSKDMAQDTERTQSGHGFATNNNDNNENNENNNKKKRAAFVKPTLEEVKNYCLERNNGIDAETFIDFYESKGWIVGKTHMKDWKACVRTWEKRKGDNNGRVERIPRDDEAKRNAEIDEYYKRVQAGEFDGDDDGLWDMP